MTRAMAPFLKLFDLNGSIAYSVLLRIWQAVAGIIGIILLSRYFSPEMQGYYYTFASLIALQSFVELGLYQVISTTASHEWARLNLGATGSIEGDEVALSRLVSLGRFVFRWYALASFCFLVVSGFGGYWFLSRSASPGIQWQAPWAVHALASSLLLMCMPFLSLLEGCNQIARVARFRVWQAVVGNSAFWLAICLGAGLWSAAVLSLVSCTLCIAYLLLGNRVLFAPFFSPPTSECISWEAEILPMQWRLALQGLVSYFTFSMFTPVIFHFHGAVQAGQMGMSQQIVMAIFSIAMVWVSTKAPGFAALIVQKDFKALDASWKRATSLSLCVMLAGVLTVFIGLTVINDLNWPTAARVLSPGAFALLAGGGVFGVALQCIAIYLRAHKKEVLMITGMVTGALMAVLAWVTGRAYGAPGLAGSYFLVMSAVSFPMAAMAMKKARREWHQ